MERVHVGRPHTNGGRMKLTIDLDSIETWDDSTVAKTINEIIKFEIERFTKSLVKDALKVQEAAMRKAVKKAAEHDWKRVAKALEQLQAAE